jgi:tetratricopeptide (TPR) repeat protein
MAKHSTPTLRSLAAMVLLLAAGATMAADPAVQAPGAAALQNLLREVWVRLHAMAPRQQTRIVTATATAGIRGAEATESEIKPYWKGDRDQDPGYRAERQALLSAQDLADAGKYAEAAKAFDSFVDAYPKSPLAPQARFGAALAQAAVGDKARAISGFETFLKQNPEHPLAHDAERVLVALRA